jgi:Ubiquitin-specific protease C-terminal
LISLNLMPKIRSELQLPMNDADRNELDVVSLLGNHDSDDMTDFPTLRHEPLLSEASDANKDGLLLFSVQEDRFSKPMSLTDKIDVLPKSWMEQCLSHHRPSLGLQKVSAEDLYYMCNKNPRIKSVFISVFSFQLYGNVAKTVKSEGGEFLTYIREDDDVEKLKHRIGSMTGESEDEVNKYRFAFVKDRSPFFLPDSISIEVGDGLKGTGDSLWNLFDNTFNNWLNFLRKLQSNHFFDFGDYGVPSIGIQRYGTASSGTRFGPFIIFFYILKPQ